jgi:hypothetical protein
MDVILINPFNRFGKEVSKTHRGVLPLGLLAVATPLDSAGYRVKIIDQQIEPQWEKLLLAELKKNPLCVGITGKDIHFQFFRQDPRYIVILFPK